MSASKTIELFCDKFNSDLSKRKEQEIISVTLVFTLRKSLFQLYSNILTKSDIFKAPFISFQRPAVFCDKTGIGPNWNIFCKPIVRARKPVRNCKCKRGLRFKSI